jgi:plastocyanin
MKLSVDGRRAAALAGVAALLPACGSGGAQPARRSGVAHLTISGYAYQPPRITVRPGTKITFANRDETAHTATSTNTGFDTGTIKPGRSATVTVTKPGTYAYYCQFHAFMHGTIVVR